MTDSLPPERKSLYPEPHRVGEREDAPPRPPRRYLAAVIAIGTVALVVAAVALGLSIGRHNGSADVTVVEPGGRTINAIQAHPGLCLDSIPDDGSVARVTAVPCSERHHAEVVASYAVSGQAWPGRDDVESFMLDRCGAFIQPGFSASSMFKPGDWSDGLRWVAWLPTEASWRAGERSGVCVVYRSGNIVGSFFEGTATFVN